VTRLTSNHSFRKQLPAPKGARPRLVELHGKFDLRLAPGLRFVAAGAATPPSTLSSICEIHQMRA
jgi:hypothetical protein